MSRHPLTFQVLAQCKTTKAKCSLMTLPHHVVETPVFMPVGTQVTFFSRGDTLEKKEIYKITYRTVLKIHTYYVSLNLW